MKQELFNIGELARRVGLNPKTIRYYEGIGLLPEPRRNKVGYRLYTGDDIPRLLLIKRAKLLGLNLAEVREIVAYADDGRCGQFKQHLLRLLDERLDEAERRIAELIAFKGDLQCYREELVARLSAEETAVEPGATVVSCQCMDS